MVNSMTGFGRSEIQFSDIRFTVEMKSVNHRYLDFNIKLPKKLSSFENAIRNTLKEYVQRGKVDVFITYEDFTQSNISLKYNKELASQYLNCAHKIQEDFDLKNDITVSKLAGFPEVLVMEETPVDEERLWSVLERALKEAGEQFQRQRNREGENLKDNLLDKLNQMLVDIREVEIRSPQIIEEYKSKLEQKTRELLEDTSVEDSRIAAEVILFADKICTDEETVRLRSHIENMMSVLKQGGTVGRKLDFIAQEMNREANTILSKANDLKTSNIAIELKTEIEKTREQIQNIE
ncbi:YicC family protein [Blautia liquoris]|uniref:YicC family protein n=1 Tax=Blautia liquoris TaxID=2779518 RepID=A0A7M2RK28_9FIRM|nr:YicC/YloC family endoribonuclease [Blautia liquoris]QOV20619.1 YicC family protein [Blautia liquoris]